MPRKAIFSAEERAARNAASNYQWRRTKTHRIAIDYTLADYEQVFAAAQAAGMPPGTYVREAVKEKMQRDKDKKE